MILILMETILVKESRMARKKVFVSFDYERDRHYKALLEAWHANPKFDFQFVDLSASEINSGSVAVVKQVLSGMINQATHTLVIVGQDANKLHKDRQLIGHRNWQNYEIAKSKEHRNKLVGIKINRDFASPEELLNAGASWAMSFTENGIIAALENA
jgi:hypothetical protein